MSFKALLNLSVNINRPVYTPDGYGGGSTSSALVATVAAAIWQAGASEPYVSDKVTAISSHIMAMVVRTDMTTRDEVVYGSNTYDVTARADDVLNKGDIMVIGLQLRDED